jgi:hypothetical protein
MNSLLVTSFDAQVLHLISEILSHLWNSIQKIVTSWHIHCIPKEKQGRARKNSPISAILNKTENPFSPYL